MVWVCGTKGGSPESGIWYDSSTLGSRTLEDSAMWGGLGKDQKAREWNHMALVFGGGRGRFRSFKRDWRRWERPGNGVLWHSVSRRSNVGERSFGQWRRIQQNMGLGERGRMTQFYQLLLMRAPPTPENILKLLICLFFHCFAVSDSNPQTSMPDSTQP